MQRDGADPTGLGTLAVQMALPAGGADRLVSDSAADVRTGDRHDDRAIGPRNGGAGADPAILASCDVAIGGTGAEVYWLYPEARGTGLAVITDVTPGADCLHITLESTAAGPVAPGPSSDGADMLVQIGSQTVAVLQEATDASVNDLYAQVNDETHA